MLIFFKHRHENTFLMHVQHCKRLNFQPHFARRLNCVSSELGCYKHVAITRESHTINTRHDNGRQTNKAVTFHTYTTGGNVGKIFK